MDAAHIHIAVEPWFQICRTKVPTLEPVPSSEPQNRFQEPVLPSLVITDKKGNVCRIEPEQGLIHLDAGLGVEGDSAPAPYRRSLGSVSHEGMF